MRDFVESEDFRHIGVQNLALYAQRLGKLFASASTWYKMIRKRGWRRPRRRVHPGKPKESLRATRPNEYWQIDATVIRLTTGIRIYLQAVIDNFSRRILVWRVSDTLSSATTRELLVEASKDLPAESANACVVVVTDGGSENFGEVNQLLVNSRSLSRVLAQIDIISSNSMIEAFWRQLKHGWLFLNTLDSTVAVRRCRRSHARRGVVRPRGECAGAALRAAQDRTAGQERGKSSSELSSLLHRHARGPAVRSADRTGPRRKPARKSDRVAGGSYDPQAP